MAVTTLQAAEGLWQVRFLERTRETNGRRLVTEWSVSSIDGPPPHRHPVMRESWEVLDGALVVTLDGVEHHLAPGGSATADPGVVHTFRKDGDAPVRWRQTNEPALSHELLFILEHRRALRSGATGHPGPIEAVRMLDVSDAWFVGIPRPLQRVLMAIGHLLNRRLRAELH